MNKALLVLPLLCVSLPAWALDIDPYKGPKPVAVLIQTNPWLEHSFTIGPVDPMVVIYADGRVIYLKREKDKAPVYLTKRLAKEEFGAVKKKLAAFGDFAGLKRYYDLAPNVTDMPETLVYFDLGDKPLVTRVYGLMTPNTVLGGYTMGPLVGKPDELPKAIKGLHEYLTTLDFKDAKPWEPEFIEVVVWGCDDDSEESIHWPKDWPGLTSPKTVKREQWPKDWLGLGSSNAPKREQNYSIFLPGKERARLVAFLRMQKTNVAVEIDGRRWNVVYRYVFPGEPVWNNAFAEKPQEPAPKAEATQSGGEK